jgi:hypothetical protein
MEGATMLTVGGVSIADQATNDSSFEIWGHRNGAFRAVMPLSVVGTIRVTTAGGFAEIAVPALASRPVTLFTAIQAAARSGAPSDGSVSSANTGQAITLVGQGFTSQTQVEFAAVDDTGVLGTLVRTGSASYDGRTLTVVVPALARTGTVRVQGSEIALPLQVVPTLRAVGGAVIAGGTIVVEGTGLTVNDLVVTIDGQAVATFALRTTVAGDEYWSWWNPDGRPDQQLLTLTVPAGISAGEIRVFTAGGTAARGGTSITTLAATADTGTPARTELASANVGQEIVLSVADVAEGDRVVFTAIDSSGNRFEETGGPESIDVAAGMITVIVPAAATTGRVRLERDAGGVILQIVPVVTGAQVESVDDDAGTMLVVLTGFGFIDHDPEARYVFGAESFTAAEANAEVSGGYDEEGAGFPTVGFVLSSR